MRIKLLAFDLDGTSIVNHWELPEANRRALLAAAERGVLLAPATGRMRSFLPPEVLALPVRYAITSNGGVVYDLSTGETLLENLIPYEKALDIHAILQDYPIYIEYYSGGRAVTSRALWERAHEMLPQGKHWLVDGKDYGIVDSLEGMLKERKLCPEKINLPCLRPEESREILERLEGLGGLRITSSIADNMEINSEEAHKGRALLSLAERLGFERGELMAVGDNGNDVTMLEAAGCSAAMGDGSEEAKAAAKYVTEAHNRGGLAQAIERWILKEE